VWRIVADPAHLPRWWPGVRRVEGLSDSRFTQVRYTKKGRPVRVDFGICELRPPRLIAWSQELAGTPFERFLAQWRVEIALEPVTAELTEVTIAERQLMRGFSRFGSWIARRTSGRVLEEALEELDRLLV
jgi:uncharacterized protein YndB with AHSA1/START domain